MHTTTFSVTVTKERAVFVPAFKIKPLRATGAGDAWDAGNLLGDANGLSDDCRLTLANAVSACYLSDPEGNHPTKQKLVKFLKESTIARLTVPNFLSTNTLISRVIRTGRIVAWESYLEAAAYAV